jgi:hypothetical protein
LGSVDRDIVAHAKIFVFARLIILEFHAAGMKTPHRIIERKQKVVEVLENVSGRYVHKTEFKLNDRNWATGQHLAEAIEDIQVMPLGIDLENAPVVTCTSMGLPTGTLPPSGGAE